MTKGVPIKQPRRQWATVELERLVKMSEYLSMPDIAKKLDRSENSIKVKLQRLNVTQRVRTGWFTEQEVCQMLDVDHQWIKRRPIKRTPFNKNHPPRKGKSTPWKILESDLKDFIQTYPEELIGRDIDIIMIVDILAGIKVSSKEVR